MSKKVARQGSHRKCLFDKSQFISNLFLVPRNQAKATGSLTLNGCIHLLHFKIKMEIQY